MDNITMARLVKLRVEESKSYGTIAEELGLSVNTVKSFCYRNNLSDEKIQKPKPSRNELIKQRPPKELRPVIGYCKECGRIAPWSVTGQPGIILMAAQGNTFVIAPGAEKK